MENENLNINLSLEEILADALANVGDGMKIPGYSELSAAIMSLGTMTEYESVNGSEAQRLQVDKTLTPEFVTIMLRMVINTLLFSDNTDIYVKALEDKLDPDSLNVVAKSLDLFKTLSNADQVLFVLFYIFFGVNKGVNALDNSKHLVTDKIKNVFEGLGGMAELDHFSDSMNTMFSDIKTLTEKLEELFKDETHKTSNFLQQFIDFFNHIINWLKTLLSKFKIA